MELFRVLRQRGYSRSPLRTIQREVEVGTQGDQGQPQRRILPLLLRYSASNKRIAAKVKKNFAESTEGQELGEREWMIIAYKRGKNLGDLLVHSKLLNRKQPRTQGRRAMVKAAGRGGPSEGVNRGLVGHWRGDRCRHAATPSPHSYGTTFLTGNMNMEVERDKVGKAIRIVFNIIKAFHHLDNLRVKAQTPGPQQLRKITRWLGEVIWPAAPNDQTQSGIENNAGGWLVSSLYILGDHYTAMKEAARVEPGTLGLTEEEKVRAIEVANRWAKNKIKTLKPAVIREVNEYVGVT
ncbi:hypothetical protein IRJ41_016815 [Triplophysa rosa]|uniref:Uncharacterized protein n=1 Tax=Triplophysa rosa TaxID=992332 RepID=A0A9W7TL77_TRIRA|nr:hypothetical protein IRJ41_016815 [Triplophysa rosa]